MKLISYAFILVFLPVSFVLYWYVFRSQKSQLAFLALLSYVFYAWVGGWFVFVLLAMSLITFLAARLKWTRLAIVVNLLPLLFVKFLLGQISFPALQFSDLILPLGISYFTFKHIGYLVDVRKGRLEAEKNLVAFLAYSAFFPQLVAGPISSYQDTGAQLKHLPQSLEKEQRSEALIYLVYGLFKKLLIADVLGEALQQGMGQVANLGWAWALLTLLMYVMQLYFDFSGYTDFVLGVGRLFGVSLPQNFNHPFGAESPRDFWNRWHISVTMWFRNYVFSPVSRSMLVRFGRAHSGWIEAAATILTMLLIGIWHNFTLGFVLWGLYNAFLILVQSWGARNKTGIGNTAIARLISQAAIILGFSFLVFPQTADTLNLWVNLFGVNGVGQHNYDPFSLVVLLVAVFLVLKGMVEARNLPEPLKNEYAYVWGIIAFLCVLFLDTQAISFTYAQF